MDSPFRPYPPQSDNRFELIVENAADAIIMVDREHRITLVNHSTETMFGYTRAELLGQPLQILVPLRFRAYHAELMEKFFVARKARSVSTGSDLLGLRKDGTEVPIAIGLIPIPTSTGPMAAAYIADVTERQRERYKFLVETVPSAMLMADPEGRIRLVNRSAETLFGYAGVELHGQPLDVLIPPRYRARHPTFVADFLAAPQSRAMGTGRDLFGLRKDGSEVPIEIGLNPIELAGGWFTLASIVDITERKRAEEIRQRMATLVEFADDAIVTKSLDGIIRTWNPAAERLLGYRADEIIGQPIARLIPDDRLGEEQTILDGIRSGDRFAHFETVRRRRDGSLVDVSLTISPICDRSGRVVGASKIMRNITERKRAEEEMRLTEAQFRATLEQRVAERTSELEAFSYSVSHDLRAPLRHIQGYIELLMRQTADAPLPEAARRHLRTISDVSGEMGQLIDDLLAFSRMGSMELQQTTVPTDDLVREAIAGLEPATGQRHIEWQIEALPPITGDAAALKQVFANLIGNAVKYTRPRDLARIEIGFAGEENGRVILFVRDNGVGFDPQYTHKLFGVFERLHRSRDFEGTGIGLAIVRRIVARHDGRVWAEGELDKGATFYFTLKPAAAI